MKIRKYIIPLTVISFTCWVVGAGSFQRTLLNQTTNQLSWPFQSKTLSQAFPTAWPGSVLHFYSGGTPTTISWSSVLNNWTQPNYVIQNGAGFEWINTSGADRTITLSGNDITASSVTLTLTAGVWYYLGDPYLRSGPVALECVLRREVPPNESYYQYTPTHLNYPGTDGDVADCWEPAGWYRGVRTTNTGPGYDPFWEDPNSPGNPALWGSWLPPRFHPGIPIWIKPAANITWVIPQTALTCE
jgi:hypothetical protein